MTARAFTRMTEDDGRIRYSLMAEDEQGVIELDDSPNEDEWDDEAEWLNRPENQAELRSEIHDCRNGLGNWARVGPA